MSKPTWQLVRDFFRYWLSGYLTHNSLIGLLSLCKTRDRPRRCLPGWPWCTLDLGSIGGISGSLGTCWSGVRAEGGEDSVRTSRACDWSL